MVAWFMAHHWITFWIISSIICIVYALIWCKALNNEMKREGYKFPKVTLSISEYIIGFTYYIIPYFNILITLLFMFSNTFKSEFKNKMIIKYNIQKSEFNKETY